MKIVKNVSIESEDFEYIEKRGGLSLWVRTQVGRDRAREESGNISLSLEDLEQEKRLLALSPEDSSKVKTEVFKQHSELVCHDSVYSKYPSLKSQYIAAAVKVAKDMGLIL